MTKTEATTLLGGTQDVAAKRLGFTRQAYQQWPEKLPVGKADRVRGAAVRLGIEIPPNLQRARQRRPISS